MANLPGPYWAIFENYLLGAFKLDVFSAVCAKSKKQNG